MRESLQAGEVIITTAGWTANVGLIEAIVVPQMPVYIDAEAHASLVDGIRFSSGRRLMLRHNDPQHLEDRVRIHGRGVIIVDALYSTDGTLADIPRYVEVAERHDCVLVVDEAHSFGMFGNKGGGLAILHGVADRVHFRTISLSKALGGHGGAVACSRDIGFSLCARMRSVLFSSSTSALLAAGHAKALAIVISDPDRAAQCLRMADLLRELLHGYGIDTMGSKSQIISIGFKNEGACQLYGELRKRRILSSVFVYPAVPKGISLVRFSVYAGLNEFDIREIAARVAESMAAVNSAEGNKP
jgi:CAI-1 autoinducer synthase